MPQKICEIVLIFVLRLILFPDLDPVTQTNAGPCGSRSTNPRKKLVLKEQCCGHGSGIRCLFDPWIQDPEYVFPQSRIWDPGSQTHIFESLMTIFGLKSTITLYEVAKHFSLPVQK